MDTSQTDSPSKKVEPFRKSRPEKFAIYRWLFIVGMIVMILRFLGVGGESDITQMANAEKTGNFVIIIVDILTDAAFIATLAYALIRPKREAFIVGATMVLFFFWSGVILSITGVINASLASVLSFLTGTNALNDISGAIASIFPLFGFLAVLPGKVKTVVSGRKEEKIVSLAVPILAGALIALMPLAYFTGSTSSVHITFHGTYVGLFVAVGIVTAVCGIFRKASLNLFWGVMMSMWILEVWQMLTYMTDPKPSYWPGLGMIMGIVACLLLLFNEPITRLATKLIFARRPVITESA